RTRTAQHVHADRAAGPLVHCRQLRPMPHLLEISWPADQGLRGRPGALAPKRFRNSEDCRQHPPSRVRVPEADLALSYAALTDVGLMSERECAEETTCRSSQDSTNWRQCRRSRLTTK